MLLRGLEGRPRRLRGCQVRHAVRGGLWLGLRWTVCSERLQDLRYYNSRWNGGAAATVYGGGEMHLHTGHYMRALIT